MTRPPAPSFTEELERRLAILLEGKEMDRRLPVSDTAVLAAITTGSFAVVLIAQAF